MDGKERAIANRQEVLGEGNENVLKSIIVDGCTTCE